MQIKLQSGAIIEFRQRISDFSFEVAILTVDKKEVILIMNPDEFKDVSLAMHKIANQTTI